MWSFFIDKTEFFGQWYLVSWGSGQGALLTYLTIPWVAMFGANVFTARIVMVLLGICAMFGFAWLMQLLTHNRY